MKSRRIPRGAGWLLARFACGPNNDSIIGDMNERYFRGCSRIWYWRQAFGVIMISLVTVIRTNQTLAVRALVTGWSLVALASLTFGPLLRLLRGNPTGSGLLPQSWITVGWAYVRGWIVPSADAYVFALLAGIAAFAIGWIIGRLNGRQYAQAVLVFVASWFVCFVPAFIVVFGKTLHDWLGTNWRYDNPYFLVFGMGGNIAAMLATLAGGLLSGCRRVDRCASATCKWRRVTRA